MQRISIAVVLVSMLIACAPPAAQRGDGSADAPKAPETPEPSASPFAQLNALAREAATLKHPLAQYEFYREHYATSLGATHGYIGQVLAASAAELGAYDQAIQIYPQGAPLLRRPPAPLPDPLQFQVRAAADAIADLSRERRIVMVNEAHHDAHTRVLTLALLPRLRDLGFTHFAAESLSEYDRELATRGYPVKGSGPYVAEPLYAEIIRTALRLGFTVVPYESAATQTDSREEEQAQNLADRVFHVQRDARLFVHGGYAHVYKSPDYLGADTMAMRLKRKTGLDPLVIDQTVLRPGAPGREYADYRTLLQAFVLGAPAVLVSRDGKSAWSLEPRFYDVSVVLPPTRLVAGRPDWLALGGAREAIAVALDLQPESLPCAIEARYAGEGDAAIPADRVLVEQGGGPVVLFLRPGEYRVAAVTATGRVFGAQRLRVAPGDGNARIPSSDASR